MNELLLERKITKLEDLTYKERMNKVTESQNLRIPLPALITQINTNSETVKIDLGNNITSYIPFNDFSIYKDAFGNTNVKSICSYLNRYVYVLIDSISKSGEVCTSRVSLMYDAIEFINRQISSEIFNGVIINKIDSGAFIELGYGILGYLKNEEYSYNSLQQIEGDLNDMIQVKILNLSKDMYSTSYNLSHKDLFSLYEDRCELYEEGVLTTAQVIDIISKDTNKNYILYFEENDVNGICDYVTGLDTYVIGDIIKVYIKRIKEKGISANLIRG